MRLAALMKVPSIFVLTHDSIGLGEDGPTHQPIEHLASLRAMPGITLIRPADANETLAAWKIAVTANSPTALVLSRQSLPVLDDDRHQVIDGASKGAYILSERQNFQLIIIASGSEVSLALAAQSQLESQGVLSRVVSMPSWEVFAQQSADYQNSVLPKDFPYTLSVEAGSCFGWQRYAKSAIGIDHFGASAPAEVLFEKFSFTVEHVCKKAKALIA